MTSITSSGLDTKRSVQPWKGESWPAAASVDMSIDYRIKKRPKNRSFKVFRCTKPAHTTKTVTESFVHLKLNIRWVEAPAQAHGEIKYINLFTWLCHSSRSAHKPSHRALCSCLRGRRGSSLTLQTEKRSQKSQFKKNRLLSASDKQPLLPSSRSRILSK